jgi:hypothetical protein
VRQNPTQVCLPPVKLQNPNCSRLLLPESTSSGRPGIACARSSRRDTIPPPPTLTALSSSLGPLHHTAQLVVRKRTSYLASDSIAIATCFCARRGTVRRSEEHGAADFSAQVRIVAAANHVSVVRHQLPCHEPRSPRTTSILTVQDQGCFVLTTLSTR